MNRERRTDHKYLCGTYQPNIQTAWETLRLLGTFVVDLAEAPWMTHVGVTMLSFGCGSLVVGSLLFDLRPTRPARWIATIGTYSYSIYLWHFLFEKGAHDYLLMFGWHVYALAYIGGAVAVGMVLGRAMEAPAR